METASNRSILRCPSRFETWSDFLSNHEIIIQGWKSVAPSTICGSNIAYARQATKVCEPRNTTKCLGDGLRSAIANGGRRCAFPPYHMEALTTCLYCQHLDSTDTLRLSKCDWMLSRIIGRAKRRPKSLDCAQNRESATRQMSQRSR